jgi:hypothetical protein
MGSDRSLNDVNLDKKYPVEMSHLYCMKGKEKQSAPDDAVPDDSQE